MMFRSSSPVKGLASALLAFALSTAPATAQIREGWASARWTGDGDVRRNARSGPEPARCKAETFLEANARELRIEGLCAIAAGKARFSLRVISDGKSALRAGIRLQPRGETVQYAGEILGGDLAFLSRAPVALHGKRYHSRISVTWLDKRRFGLNQWLREAGNSHEHLTVSLQFERIGATK